MSVQNVVFSLQTIQRNHIKNCVIINSDSLNMLFKVANNPTLTRISITGVDF